MERPEPRSDCRRLARCGYRSAYMCRRIRDIDIMCAECTLVRTHVRKNVRNEGGRVMRRCSSCGEWLPETMFYIRHVNYKGKVYILRESRCKICRSSDYRKKTIQRIKER